MRFCPARTIDSVNASLTALARRLRLPQILCVHDHQCNMRNAAAPDDMTYTGPVRSQANIAGVEDIHEVIAAGFHLQLTGQEEGEVIDDLRMPIDEPILPAHET
jgi:hypothetical protein